MSDQTTPEPGAEIEVDLSAFLPEGVTLDDGSNEAPTDEAQESTELADEAPDSAVTDGYELAVDRADPAEPAVSAEVAGEPAEVTVRTATDDEPAAEDLAPDPEPPVVVDDSIDLDLIDAVDADLSAVEAALSSLDDGTYGSCAVCRSAIAADLLASDPVRRTCLAHN